MKLDDEDVKSYDRRSFLDQPEPQQTSALNIFLAVLGAILVSWIIREAYLQWQLNQAAEILTQQMQSFTAQSQQQLQAVQATSEAARAEAEARVRYEAQQKELQRQAMIQQENERQAQKAAAIAEEARKEAAWEKFYKPAPGCESTNPNPSLIECGNDHIRARKKFEDYWASRH